MKKQIIAVIFALGIAGVINASQTFAQSNHLIRIDVPFAFSANNETLPAGTYVVKPARDDRVMRTIQDNSDKEKIDEQAQEDTSSRRQNGRRLEGVWKIVVTANSPCGNPTPNPASFPAMETYVRGGTMLEYALGAATTALPPGTLRGGRTTAQGTWHYESNGVYSVALQFFRFGADHAYTGTTKGVLEISLTDDGNSFTSTETSQIFNTADVLILTRCNTRVGTRFE